jgi:hypothetical protein
VQTEQVRTIVLAVFAEVVAFGFVAQAQALGANTKYPIMAPLEQYLTADRDSEIALARSAAPRSISEAAEVLVLVRHGYESAVNGANGFVCMVARSWTAGIDDPEFWNPKLRSPICYNPPAARSYLPIMIERTKLVVAGKSKAQMVEVIESALDKKQLPALEPGAMCYMMSKQGYVSDQDGHWHPHLMFFVPLGNAKTWGAGFSGSPILVADDASIRLSVLLLPVAAWSDGTPDSDHQR